MSSPETYLKPTPPREIAAALAGRRFGLCGFGADEIQRISRILGDVKSFPIPVDERLLGGPPGYCDALVMKLASASPEGLRAASASKAPILMIGPSQTVLEGAGAAYGWPDDFMSEPWPQAEFVVRLFRLLSPVRHRGGAAPRTEPMVVLADDDPELVALVEVTLRNGGILCRTAEDGLSALRLARELDPDLIALDIEMPGLDGFEVLETIRRDPSLQMLPVIMLTGCGEASDVMRGAELRADDYLTKPISPIRLLNRVKRLLSHAGSTPRPPRASAGNTRPAVSTARPRALGGSLPSGIEVLP